MIKMVKYEKIRNVQELKQELLRISETDECRNTRLMALALAYLLSELCGTDRTTGHVTERAWENIPPEKRLQVKKNGKPI